MKIYGDNFPKLTVADIDFGTGVTVSASSNRPRSRPRSKWTSTRKPIVGKRDVAVRRTVAPNAIAVYDKIDYIKVIARHCACAARRREVSEGLSAVRGRSPIIADPTASRTRRTMSNSVGWTRTGRSKNFIAVYGDDDKEFVGKMSPTGFFTPAVEGPNPKRKFSRNNYGDVWAVATYKGATGQGRQAAHRAIVPGGRDPSVCKMG